MKKQNSFLNNLKKTVLTVALFVLAAQVNAQLSVWHFEESTDASPITYNATAVGSPTYTAGKVGNALTLSGTRQYLTTPFVINPLNASFTVTTWVKYTGTIGNSLSFSPVIVQQADGSGTGRGWLWLSSYSATAANSLKFASSIGGSATYGTTTPVANTWYMVSVTYSSTSVKIYVNGVLDGSSTKTSETSVGGLLIGCNKSFGTLWTGLIDELAVYDTALSAGDLLTIYNNTSTSVNQTPAASNKMYAADKKIVVEGVVADVSVFDLNGRNIQTSKLAGTFTSKPLNAGMYIIKADGMVRKLAIQ